MSEPLATYAAGDRLPSLRSADLPGYVPFDLTDWTVVLTMTLPNGAELEKTAVYADDDARSDGAFTFEWGASDLVVGIDQHCYVQATKDFADPSPPDLKTITLSTFTIDVFTVPT